MFETLFTHQPSIKNYRAAPLADERIRYLERCVDDGFSRVVLQRIALNQLRLIEYLGLTQQRPVTRSPIEDAAKKRLPLKRSQRYKNRQPRTAKAKSAFVHDSVQWLRFLGWLHEPPAPPLHPHVAEVAAFAEWARTERGYAESTIECYCDAANEFFVFLAESKSPFPLASVQITDIDCAIAARAASRNLSRRTISNYARRLPVFFRFAEDRGWCRQGIADAIKGPRIYTNENLPPRLARADVLRILETTEGDRPADVRDRAILMLLTTYGLRSGEIRRMRVDDLDWKEEMIRVRRSKSSKTEYLPLSSRVGHAILRYLREVRPSGLDRLLFYTVLPPIRPLTRGALLGVVRNRLVRLNIVAQQTGPHAIRHATAQHLLDQGKSFTVIGKLLGHASLASTGAYAKVDLKSLREVAKFDLGELLL